jgi:hypothetical protein
MRLPFLPINAKTPYQLKDSLQVFINLAVGKPDDFNPVCLQPLLTALVIYLSAAMRFSINLDDKR